MKSAQEYEQEILDGLQADTGKDLSSWMDVMRGAGLAKRNELLTWLKADQGLNHGRANTLVGIFHNDGKPVYQSADSLKDAQFAKREHLRPLYDAVEGEGGNR